MEYGWHPAKLISEAFKWPCYHWPVALPVTIKLAPCSDLVRRLGSKGVLFRGTHAYPSNPWPSEGTFPAPSAQPTLREFTNIPTNFSLLGQRSEEQGSRVWRWGRGHTRQLAWAQTFIQKRWGHFPPWTTLIKPLYPMPSGGSAMSLWIYEACGIQSEGGGLSAGPSTSADSFFTGSVQIPKRAAGTLWESLELHPALW